MVWLALIIPVLPIWYVKLLVDPTNASMHPVRLVLPANPFVKVLRNVLLTLMVQNVSVRFLILKFTAIDAIRIQPTNVILLL